MTFYKPEHKQKRQKVSIERIVSGGQTGVDRAALDVAIELGVACGGWCPRRRKAEDGPIGARYPLQETPSAAYAVRTEWNVRDSDGTLILTAGEPVGGTALTRSLAAEMGKPCLTVDLDRADHVATVTEWVAEHQIKILNVAGPRESTLPGIYLRAAEFLRRLLEAQ